MTNKLHFCQGEDIHEAAIREVKEETGVSNKISSDIVYFLELHTLNASVYEHHSFVMFRQRPNLWKFWHSGNTTKY